MNTEQKITLLRKARAKVIGASADLAELGFGGEVTQLDRIEENLAKYTVELGYDLDFERFEIGGEE